MCSLPALIITTGLGNVASPPGAAAFRPAARRWLWLIDIPALTGHPSPDVAVVVPVVVVHPNESKSTLRQTSRHQSRIGKAAGLMRIFFVQLKNVGSTDDFQGDERRFAVSHSGSQKAF